MSQSDKDKVQNGGIAMAKYKCWKCGKEIEFKREPMLRIYCDECLKEVQEEHDELINEYAKLKIRVMHETALRTMEKSGHCYMHEYKRSADRILQNALNQTENYNSSDEVVTAIVLDNYNYYFEPNKKVLNYRVDFYIPELKVCLEVDGHLHKNRLEYDSLRDTKIRDELGLDWEIVRIGTKYIEQNPEKIPDAVEALANERRRWREKQSCMPYGFSKRDNTLYKM